MGCNQESGFPSRLNIFLEVSGPFISDTKSYVTPQGEKPVALINFLCPEYLKIIFSLMSMALSLLKASVSYNCDVTTLKIMRAKSQPFIHKSSNDRVV